MELITEENLFTKKHHQLLNLASVANGFAWVVLVVFALVTVSVFFQAKNSFVFGNNPVSTEDEFYRTLRTNFFYDFNMILHMLEYLFQGILFWLVLKGASMGLNMIVETDINYRLKKREDSNG